nr:putative ribonuclease H-like domain-containing protein [Tanacetum cinerariifolium]
DPVFRCDPIWGCYTKSRVTQPRYAKPFVTKSKSPIRRHLTHSHSPKTSNSPPRVTAFKAQVVSVAQDPVFRCDPIWGCYTKSRVTQPRYAKPFVTKSKSPIRRHLTRSHSPKTSNSPARVTAFKAQVVSVAQGNMSYLSDFEELNGGHVAFGVTDDYSTFTWVFFLATKDETSPILKTFITGLENQLSLKVKVTRSDNGTEFKNNDLNQFCGIKGIKREFSVPRIPQQNGIDERKNRTLIEAARTMLADSLLPIPFLAE